ncbi:MAG: hypothetical protein K6D59_00550 [Bacteroidales bacterium]|nr:hypothetical protein [Bacteroidales bacterium]
MMKKCIILAALLFSVLALNAQTVTDVQFDQEGSRVKVTYTLRGRVADIGLSISTNGGMTFKKLNKIVGDVGERIEPGQHVVYWNATEEVEEIDNDDVVFRVDCRKATPLRKTFALLNVSYHIAPQMAMGFTYGQVKKAGWYVSLLTNAHFNYSYDGLAGNNGLVNGACPFYSGNSRKSYFAANAGMTFRLGDPTWMYLGLGYGNRIVAQQTLDDKWYAQSSAWYKGLSFDAGIMMAIKKILLSLGVHSVGFEYLEFKAGVGMNF